MSAPIDGAWAEVEEAGSRLLVRWGGAGFDELKADFRRRFPRHGDAVYLPEQRAWSVPREHTRRLEAWLAMWVDAEAVAWDRSTRRPAPAQALALASSYKVLHLTDDAPIELVEAARRVLSKRYHPDAGGTDQAMAAINAAADFLLAQRAGSPG